jgi:predicted esterase
MCSVRRSLAVTVLTSAAFAAASPRAPAEDAAHGAGADAGAVDPKQMKEWLALCDEWFAAKDDGAKLLVEGRAAKLAPLPAAAVQPIAEHLFESAAKAGPKLKKSGTNYLYDEKAKKGLYMVAPSAKRRGGLLIAMHGGGEGAGDAGSAFGVWAGATANGMTVIAPEVMTKVGSAWNEDPEERMVLDLIEAAKRTWDIDTNRICLAGHSMGGDGSWMLGGRNADLLAGCAPLAGSVMPYMRPGKLNRRETPLADYLGLMEGVLPNLMHVPYHISHSADDRNEAIHPDDIATGRLKTLQARFPGRYEFVYDRIDGNGHALPPRGVKPILEWLAKKQRVTYPREVVWETWRPWKRQMYWLYHPEPLDSWRFHAKLGDTPGNSVEVSATTKPLESRKNPEKLELTLLLSPRLVDFARPLKVTSGGKTLFEGAPQRTLWALLVSVARRNDPAQWFEGHVTVDVPRTMWKDFWDE